MSRPILQMLANELAALLEPISRAAESEDAMQALLAESIEAGGVLRIQFDGVRMAIADRHDDREFHALRP